MEQITSTSLFSLNIDPVTKAHLSETSRWARFLAIVGMVFVALAAVGVLFIVVAGTMASGSLQNGIGDNPYSSGILSMFGIGAVIFYALLLLIWFFPLLYLLRFANKMRTALNGNDQQALNTSFQNLKACLRFVGIITLIILAFYAIAIIFGVIGAAVFS